MIEISEYAKKYEKSGFIPFSLNIATKPNGKKELKNVPCHSTITKQNYKKEIDKNKNGMAIRLGLKMHDDKHLVVIDVDNKDEDDKINGMEGMKELENKYGKIKTLKQQTGNGGEHYLLKLQEEKMKRLLKSITTMIINDKRYAIDYKSENGFLLVEPSNYNRKYYKWITPLKTPIADMPDKQIFINSFFVFANEINNCKFLILLIYTIQYIELSTTK